MIWYLQNGTCRKWRLARLLLVNFGSTVLAVRDGSLLDCYNSLGWIPLPASGGQGYSFVCEEQEHRPSAFGGPKTRHFSIEHESGVVEKECFREEDT